MIIDVKNIYQKINIINKHDELTKWGNKKTFPNVKFQDVRIQMQEPQ